MASSGIFSLTAFTALAAGDVLVAVDVSDTAQSPQGSTRKITVANFFSAIPVTLGVGGAADASVGVFMRNTTAAATSMYGFASQPTAPSGVTNALFGYQVALNTAAAAFTVTNAYGMYVDDLTKGAGSAVTNQYGIYIAAQTKGGTINRAIYVAGGTSEFQALIATTGVFAGAVSGVTTLAGSGAVSGFTTGDFSSDFSIGSGTRAAAGVLRMASGKIIAWRNNANSGDVTITKDASDIMQFSGAATFGGRVITVASASGGSGFRLPLGAAPSAPAEGDMWYDGTNVKFRDATTSRTITWV